MDRRDNKCHKKACGQKVWRIASKDDERRCVSRYRAIQNGA